MIAPRKLMAEFAPETRFGVVPLTAVPFRGPVETQLEALKQQLLAPLLEQHPATDVAARLRWAAADAASLAWLTPFPLLILPSLLEEKTQTALAQAARQQEIRCRSQRMLPDFAGSFHKTSARPSHQWRPAARAMGISRTEVHPPRSCLCSVRYPVRAPWATLRTATGIQNHPGSRTSCG